MSPCEFEQEGYCCLQAEYPEIKEPCPKMGKNRKCLAKEKDLVEVCEFCLKPNCYGECLIEESGEVKS